MMLGEKQARAPAHPSLMLRVGAAAETALLLGKLRKGSDHVLGILGYDFEARSDLPRIRCSSENEATKATVATMAMTHGKARFRLIAVMRPPSNSGLESQP
jgi:hypothetical protein